MVASCSHMQMGEPESVHPILWLSAGTALDQASCRVRKRQISIRPGGGGAHATSGAAGSTLTPAAHPTRAAASACCLHPRCHACCRSAALMCRSLSHLAASHGTGRRSSAAWCGSSKRLREAPSTRCRHVLPRPLLPVNSYCNSAVTNRCSLRPEQGARQGILCQRY